MRRVTDSSVSKSIQCTTAFLPRFQECDGGPKTFDYKATQWRAVLVKFLHAWGSDAAAAAAAEDVYEVESKWYQRKAGGAHQIYIMALALLCFLYINLALFGHGLLQSGI